MIRINFWKLLQKSICIFVLNPIKTKYYFLKYKEIKVNIDNNIYNKDKDPIYRSKTSKIEVSYSNFELNKKAVISKWKIWKWK